MKKIYLFVTICLLLGSHIFAQDIHGHRTCGTMEYREEQMKKHPEYAQRYAEIEAHTQNYSANNQAKTKSLIIIPVVVHNVYKNATDSINMNDVLSQIDSLNKDFRLQNADKSKIPAPFLPVASDFEILFCLANKDPQGNATTGLTHTLTTTSSFSTSDNIKSSATGGKDPWTSADYLNIWVGELSGGLLGYATFPGGAANVDGVVIGANCFGSQNPNLLAAYNLGRTAPHEIGHWLNLIHIWGDSPGCSPDDLVNDTPIADKANFGCETYPFLTTCQAAAPGEMFMNYMDYGDDNCIIMFTDGQKTRARALFDPGGARESLLNSAVTHCAAIVPPLPTYFVNAGVISIQSPIDTVCSSNISPVFTLTNIGNISLSSAVIQYSIDGGSPISYTWTGSLDSLETAIVTLPNSIVNLGGHSITISITSSNGAADPIPSNDSQTQNFYMQSVVGQAMPFFEGFESATFPNNNITILNPDAGITWESTNLAWFLGAQSCRIRNVNNSTIGAIDELQLPTLDWTNLSYPKLEFDVAYANYTQGASDTLEILISTDCGSSYQKIAKLFGATLTSTHATTTAFVPTSSEWKHKAYNLTSFNTSGSNVAKIIFRNISGYENNLYLDNINVLATPTTISQSYNLGQLLSFYPNPATDKIHLEYIASENEDLFVEMLDLTGRSIEKWTEPANIGKNEWDITLSEQAKGVYILRFSNGKTSYAEKISIK